MKQVSSVLYLKPCRFKIEDSSCNPLKMFTQFNYYVSRLYLSSVLHYHLARIFFYRRTTTAKIIID